MYDLLLELSHTIMKNGLSLSALGTAIYVLLKHRKVKRRLRRLIPWLLEDDNDTKQYIANQARIEAKLDVLARHMGVDEWNLPPSTLSQDRNLRRFCNLLRKAFQWGSPSRRMMKMNQFLSGKKKLLTFILMVLLNGLNDTLSLGLSNETITTVSALGGGYIVVEGIIDIVRAIVSKQKKTDSVNPEIKYR